MDKSKEGLQAQIIEFANNTLPEFSKDHELIVKNVGVLANINDLDQLPNELSPDLRDIIEKYKDRYINFLRQKTERKKILSAEDYLKLYNNKFRTIVEELKKKFAEEGEKMPEYIGKGSNGRGFKINLEGQDYCIKIHSNLMQGNYELKALRRGKGMPRLSQLTAYSLEDGVTVMEFLPGKEVTQFELDQEPKYTDEEIKQLMNIVVEMDENGLVIDPKPSNFMYDKDKGFSILDYHTKVKGNDRTVADSIADLRVALSYKNYPDFLGKHKCAFDSEAYKTEAYPTSMGYLLHSCNTSLRVLKILQHSFPSLLDELKSNIRTRRDNPQMSGVAYVDIKKVREQYQEYAPYVPNAKDKIREIEDLLREIEKFEI